MDERFQQLNEWLSTTLKLPRYDICPASSDASFRRYFRVSYGDKSYVVMDAPPSREDCVPFIKVAKAFKSLGLNVPAVLEEDLRNGFLLLSDLGNRQYLSALSDATVETLYGDAFVALAKLQSATHDKGEFLPLYDEP